MHSAQKQMSESLLVGVLLSFSGGLQDAYTYLCRGHIYANAQTGNVILLSMSLADGAWRQALSYLIPLAAFVAGLLLAQLIRFWMGRAQKLHWRQLILLIEIILLLCAGLLPEGADRLSSALVSFACALQADSFRSVANCPYASTMCIGNLRSAADSFAAFWTTGDRARLRRGLLYLFFIVVFALGAVAGGRLVCLWHIRAVWACCGLLLLALLLMFRRTEEAALPPAQS